MLSNPEWQCPECGGQWIRNFVFRHKANACTLRDAEDATQYADHHRLEARRKISRPATATELTLLSVFIDDPEAEPVDPETATTTVTRDYVGMHERIVADINPDNLIEEEDQS